jgi:TolB-like protein
MLVPGCMTPGWIFLALACLLAVSAGAQTNSLHLAVMPFSAPEGDAPLEQAAASLPDLLMTALSQDDRFILVEREKINTVWSELHLAQAGLDSADTVARLGRELSCDWLVSGSLVKTAAGAQVWVKVTDTQTSEVIDLQAITYNATNFPALAADMAKFLSQARSRGSPREFVALETFRNLSVSTTREDWTPRLTALIESNLLAAGYGVVERESVAPIFAEYQLQNAGMTADASKRVHLKPAFWVVGGTWKWFHDTEDKLSVMLLVQRMGGGQQMVSYAKPPGPELDQAIVEGVEAALKASGSVTPAQALAGEEKMRQAHVDELIHGRGVYAPSIRSFSDTSAPPVFMSVTDAYGHVQQRQVDPGFLAQHQMHKEQMLKTLKQAILLNPQDWKSKFALGVTLFGSADAVDSKQGSDFLEEVAASGDPAYAPRAKAWLDDVRAGKIEIVHDAMGSHMVTHGQPESFPKQRELTAEEKANLAAKTAKFLEVTNVAPMADQQIKITHNPFGVGSFDGGQISSYWIGRVLDKGPLFIVCGGTLKSFDWTGMIGSGSGVDFEDVKLPMKLDYPVTAITGDPSTMWVGTDGGGLIKIPAHGDPVTYGEKDGFPMASIRSLATINGKFLIGFGRGRAGAFGTMDLNTMKFTGLMSPDMGHKPGDDPYPPPPRNSVWQIKSDDARDSWWIGTDPALYHLDLATMKWRTELPRHDELDYPNVGVRTLTADVGYTATVLSPGGVGICRTADDSWTHLNLSTNYAENAVTTLCIDQSAPKYLWVGGFSKIWIVDMSTQKIVGVLKTVMPGQIHLIIVFKKDVYFIGDGQYSGTYLLYYWEKPEYP